MEWGIAEATNSILDFHQIVSFRIKFIDSIFKNHFFLKIAFNHPSTTITRVCQDAQKMLEAQQKDNALQHSAATGSAILDTYWQLIKENAFGKF